MTHRDPCPSCGAELVPKGVEKLLRGGNDTAVVAVEALVCTRCGEKLYDESTVRRFEEIRSKLERHDTEGFRPLGHSYQVA
jgi:YgiT-type zinc finger domain-containing protein